MHEITSALASLQLPAWLHPTLLAQANDSMWSGEFFQKETWEKFIQFLRLVLCFGGALLLVAELRARRLGTPLLKRGTAKWVYLSFTVLAFGVYFDFGNPNTRYSEYYHRHEFYHYYLGSKFFEEVHYSRLYECTVAAEMENGHKAEVLRREMRDLAAKNLIKPVPDVIDDPEQCKKHFRDESGKLKEERWEAFKKDIEWFRKSAYGGDYWHSMIKDHGYNPPPVWTMTGKFFGSFGVADDGFFKRLAMLDVLFHIGIVVMIGWAFGWRVMMIATVFWGCNAPANFYWTGGAFMRQDWIFFIVASICLVRKNRFFLGGWALMWAGLLRVFPMGLFFGYGLVCLIYWVMQLRRGGFERLKQSRLFKQQTRLIAGAAMALAVLGGASVAVTGAEAWGEFKNHISLHTGTALTNHMGLKTMLTHDWGGRMRFTRDNGLDDPFEGWKDGRKQRDDQTKPIRYLLVFAMALWAFWILRRTKLLWIGMPLGCAIVMGLTDMTCYYMSMFIVGATLSRLNPMIGPMMLLTSGFSQILLQKYYFVDDKYAAMSWLFMAMGLLLYWGISRPFSMERLKAWWNFKPEPKSDPKLAAPAKPASAKG